MSEILPLSEYNFAPVMDYPPADEMKVFDFTGGYDADYVRSFEWGIGQYDEKRAGMYTANQFGGMRNIHMGIDIWSRAGNPVYSFYDGLVAYKTNNNRPGDYGPTLILKYDLNDGLLYALYGHLSDITFRQPKVGDRITKGEYIGTIGRQEINGGWAPHLHFQLALEDPGKADMPGVVSEDNHAEALGKYPDPRKVLGNLY